MHDWKEMWMQTNRLRFTGKKRIGNYFSHISSGVFSNNIRENIPWILVFAAWCWLLHSVLLKQEAAFHISVSVKRRVMDITFLFPETGSQYNLAVYVFSCGICVNFQCYGLYSPFHTLQSLNDSSPLRFHIIVFFLLSR